MSVELATNQWHGSTIIFLMLVAIIVAVLVVLTLQSDNPFEKGTSGIIVILLILAGAGIGRTIAKNGDSSPEELAQGTLTNIEESYGVNLSTPVSEPIEDLSNSPIDVTISFSNTGQSPVSGAILIEDGRASVFVKEQGVLVPANDYINNN